MTDNRVWTLPSAAPSPTELAEAWSRVVTGASDMLRSTVGAAANPPAPLPFDPASPVRAFSAFASHLLTNPAQAIAAQQHLFDRLVCHGERQRL